METTFPDLPPPVDEADMKAEEEEAIRVSAERTKRVLSQRITALFDGRVAESTEGYWSVVMGLNKRLPGASLRVFTKRAKEGEARPQIECRNQEGVEGKEHKAQIREEEPRKHEA